MDAAEAFATALEYETRIRDLYISAVDIVDDETGKKIFKALSDDEQSHMDFLEKTLSDLKKTGEVNIAGLEAALPPREAIENAVREMTQKIPEQILGDVKRLLSSALKLEVETSDFYRGVMEQTQGNIKEIFKKFLDIEEGHVAAVQAELDFATGNGFWFNFMEIDMEY